MKWEVSSDGWKRVRSEFGFRVVMLWKRRKRREGWWEEK